MKDDVIASIYFRICHICLKLCRKVHNAEKQFFKCFALPIVARSREFSNLPLQRTRRSDNVIMTLKRRHNDDIVICPLGCRASTTNKQSNETTSILIHLGPLLQIWINLNTNMDRWIHDHYSRGWNYVSIPKLQRCNNDCNYLPMLRLKLIHVSEGGFCEINGAWSWQAKDIAIDKFYPTV